MTDRKTLSVETMIGNASIKSRCWINKNDAMNYIWLQEGDFTFSTELGYSETINLIRLLERHMVNIKENETELIAMISGVAA